MSGLWSTVSVIMVLLTSATLRTHWDILLPRGKLTSYLINQKLTINFQVKQRLHYWQRYQVLRFSSTRQGRQTVHCRRKGQEAGGKGSGLIFLLPKKLNKKKTGNNLFFRQETVFEKRRAFDNRYIEGFVNKQTTFCAKSVTLLL